MLSKIPPAFNKTLFQDSSDGGHPQGHFQQEDDDLVHALSLSLEVFEYSFYLYNSISPFPVFLNFSCIEFRLQSKRPNRGKVCDHQHCGLTNDR